MRSELPHPSALLLWLLLCTVACGVGGDSQGSAPAGFEFPPAFSVGDGGGAAFQGLATMQCTINGNHTLASGARSSSGWRSLAVDRTAKSGGVIAVHAIAARFTLERLYIAASHGRVLVNDTFTCTSTSKCALYTNHTAEFQQPTVVRLNGAFDAPQLGQAQKQCN